MLYSLRVRWVFFFFFYMKKKFESGMALLLTTKSLFL